MLGTPPSWQAQLVQQLNTSERLSLFKCSHAAACMVLNNAPRTMLMLTRRHASEAEVAAARRHHVAMSLAAAARDVHLCTSEDFSTAVPQCIHSSITTLEFKTVQLDAATWVACSVEQLGKLNTIILRRCTVLQDASLTDMHLQLQSNIHLACDGTSPQCLIQLGSVWGHAVKRLDLRSRMTANELQSVAAVYSSVTHLDVGHNDYFSDDTLHVVLHEWKSLQHLAVGSMRLQLRVLPSRLTLKHLEYRCPTWPGLANLPLGGIQSLAIHRGLFACGHHPNNRKSAQISPALQNLRGCKRVDLVGCDVMLSHGMRVQKTFIVEGLSSEHLAKFLEIVSQSNSQPPVVCARHCKVEDPSWMPAMLQIPTGVSTLMFLDCHFKEEHSNEEQYWAKFAASLPPHVTDLAVQFETYQQALAVISAFCGNPYPGVLWLYLGRRVQTRPGCWRPLYQLRDQLRPTLKLRVDTLEPDRH